MKKLNNLIRKLTFFKNYKNFADVVLDRIYFLTNNIKGIDVSVKNPELLKNNCDDFGKVICLGAHIGSFEALRYTTSRDGYHLTTVGFFKNTSYINDELSAIGPNIENFIELANGTINAVAGIKQALDEGKIVGIIADRSGFGESQKKIFLGEEIAFPKGPYQIAYKLSVPIIFSIAIYESPDKYTIENFKIFDPKKLRGKADDVIDEALENYIKILEEVCHRYPNNWFNFYNFLGE